MKKEWAYKVTVGTADNGLEYEGRFVSFCRAEKAAQRKLEQYEGSGAVANIYGRWDGSCITKIA